MCSIPPRTPPTTELRPGAQHPTDDICPRTGKVAHRHRSAALAACRVHNQTAIIRGKDLTAMEPYLCRCGKWHTGNKDRSWNVIRPYTKADRTGWKADQECDFSVST